MGRCLENIQKKGLKAIIIETFGSGNATTQKWFVDAIKKAIDKGIFVLNVTQCNAGKVEQGKYATSAALKKIGVIGGFDITSEGAVAKLMFVLGASSDKKEIEMIQNKIQFMITKRESTRFIDKKIFAQIPDYNAFEQKNSRNR